MIKSHDNPNINELREAINNLKCQLLELLDLYHYYQSDIYQRIMFLYDNIFGDLEDEIEEKNLKAKELEKKVEILKLKTRNNSPISEKSVKFMNMMMDREQKRISSRDAQKPKNEKLANITNINCEVNDNYELPQLYRQLVKKLHPDVAGNTDDFRKYWDNIQHAYKSKDVDRIRYFYTTLCKDINTDFPDPKIAVNTLKMELRDLEASINKQKRRINELKTQEPFSFEEKLNDKIWIAKRKNYLRDRLFQIDRKIQHSTKMINILSSNNKAGGDFLQSLNRRDGFGNTRVG